MRLRLMKDFQKFSHALFRFSLVAQFNSLHLHQMVRAKFTKYI